ncbi:hypothetical protein A0H81_13081 [Grifola frondosa]|uniref:Uncharacterized protein n=1 Tax=Grifola frondosa TaxID=5627 RepID=A0A1C7LSP9_GRIFR|nr:hypothetical protein A0H81_13081 [Grifola frondosa]
MDTEASSSSARAQPHRARPTASTALWGHLLRKDVTSQTLSNGIPASSFSPITPLDKAGSSMRILLHDTQANLERFSDRVIKMTGSVDETKRELVTVRELFQQEHEQLVDEIVNLVNRCQTEVQKSVGNPAQRENVNEIHKDLSSVDTKLESLDKKIDILHMLNQTQSQALQTLQDQQMQILAALAPILPLVQAIPLHIDNSQHNLKEAIRGICTTPNMDPRTTRVENIANHPSPAESAVPETPQRKKRRLDEDSATRSSPCLSVQPTAGSRNFGLPIVSPRKFLLSETPARAPTSRLFPTAISSSPTVLTPFSRRSTVRTPRRIPLFDLLHPNSAQYSATSTHKIALTPGIMDPSADLRVSSDASNHPALSNSGILLDTSLTNVSSTTPAAMRHAVPQATTFSVALTTASKTPLPLPRTSQPSSPLSNVTSAVDGAPTHLPEMRVAKSGPTISGVLRPLPGISAHRQPEGPGHHSSLGHDPLTASSFAIRTLPVVDSNKPMRLKDRRALLAEPLSGKRFIPLDDDDDADPSVR